MSNLFLRNTVVNLTRCSHAISIVQSQSGQTFPGARNKFQFRPPPNIPRPAEPSYAINQCPEHCVNDEIPANATYFDASSRYEERSARSWLLECSAGHVDNWTPGNYFVCRGECGVGEFCFQFRSEDSRGRLQGIQAFCVSDWIRYTVANGEDSYFDVRDRGGFANVESEIVLTRPNTDAVFDATYLALQVTNARGDFIDAIDDCIDCHFLQFVLNPEWATIKVEVELPEGTDAVDINAFFRPRNA